MGIEDDPWIRAEIIPPNLAILRARVIDHFDLPPANFGIRGRLSTHRRGHHRSRAFILNSPYCTDREYSVTAAVNRGGNPNWLAGFDITIDKRRLLPMCRRLDVACRAGTMEKITEWYGNLDGDLRVDGFDNLANVIATSDDSHLFHLHGSVARGRANDDHTDLFNVLTGKAVVTLPTKTQSVRIYDPTSPRVVETLVPPGSGITTWGEALHHWYRVPHDKGSLHELDHSWRLRAFNDTKNGPGRWDTLVPGSTVLLVPQLLGY